MSPSIEPGEERIVVLAPLWRDAQVTCRVLSSAGFDCHAHSDLSEARPALEEGVATLLVTEEALGPDNRAMLLELLHNQPAWSDLPVVLFLAPGDRPLRATADLRTILPGHNLTVLRRPVSSATLVSVVDASLRARRRQYQLRAHLQQREQYAETLEQEVRARTQRLQALSDEYEAARDLFFTLFQVNPLPIAIVRLTDGLFLDANDAFLAYFDVTRESVVGQFLSDEQERLPWRAALEILARLRRFGAVRNFETAIQQPSQDVRTVLASAELVTLQSAEAALVTFVDISERKEAEEKIRELASQLARAEHQERHRIAQILHDDLQQQLYGLQLQLSFLRDEATEEMERELDAIEPTVGTALKIVRDLSVDLSPPILYDEGLRQGIEWIASRMNDQYQLVVRLHAAGSFPIADEGERVLLFQIVRELLFNAVKHAGVREVDVSLRDDGGRVRIDVVDQGAGFDPQALHHDRPSTLGRGLRSAQERLRLIGGRLEIHSTPGEGTHATVFAPH